MQRLTRLDWIYTDTPVYFITAVTHGRQRILADEATHAVFRAFCQSAHDRGVLVGSYVLMPDHLHVFVCVPPGDGRLSAWMKSLKNTLSKHWRSQGIAATHWQKGYFDHLLRSEESHAEKWKYVRDNPVRAQLCLTPDDWPYAGQIQPDSGL
jgi:putative transposase